MTTIRRRGAHRSAAHIVQRRTSLAAYVVGGVCLSVAGRSTDGWIVVTVAKIAIFSRKV